jgi:hypothetical protein
MFLWNFGSYTDYRVLYPRKWQPSTAACVWGYVCIMTLWPLANLNMWHISGRGKEGNWRGMTDNTNKGSHGEGIRAVKYIDSSEMYYKSITVYC